LNLTARQECLAHTWPEPVWARHSCLASGHHVPTDGVRCSAVGVSPRCGVLLHRTGMALQRIVSVASIHVSKSVFGIGIGAAACDDCAIRSRNGVRSRSTLTRTCTYIVPRAARAVGMATLN